MSNKNSLFMNAGEDINIDDIIDLSEGDDIANSVFNDAILEASAAQRGIQASSLQSAMDNYAKAMDQSAIAKSTGLPVRSSTQSYKGFIAEEYLKNTLKINALAKGKPDWQLGVYTKEKLPDGSVLSGIDKETDISIWTRKYPWSKPKRTVDYQSKVHNDANDYVKDINNKQYKNVKFVGASGQGVNDRIKVRLGKDKIGSDTSIPKEYADMTDDAKAQSTPEYAKKREKYNELHKVNLERAVMAGAATGLMISTVEEIVSVIKNSKDLSEEQFVKSINHIMYDTVEGGVRGGAIEGSVQLFGKMLGREVAANSFEAIPAMAIANVSVDLAKDLYKCFVTQTIDTDDLLCNSVNNVFKSTAGFSGAWAAGQVGGQIAVQFSSQGFVQAIGSLSSAKTAAATGAAIGSALGPLGTIIGSVVGGLIIGIGANTIISTANKDAQKAYEECILEITSCIEANGCEKLYYFADAMASISDFRLSFKDLLPCYNLISDLREYNLHKKKIKEIEKQLNESLENIDIQEKEALNILDRMHKKRILELKSVFEEQRIILEDDFKESVNTYVSNSYMQYISVYEILEGNVNDLIEELKNRKTEHSYVLDYMRHRNAINEQLNETLNELIYDENIDLLRPFIDKITRFMQQDELMIGRQYISFEEALYLVDGE